MRSRSEAPVWRLCNKGTRLAYRWARMKLICKLFGHKWSGCSCVRCSETDSTREPHDWSGCRCCKCRIERHDWSEWEDHDKEKCLQERFCRRCNQKTTRDDHQFHYKMKDSCCGKRICLSCGVTEDVEQHTFRIESTEMYDVEHDMNNLVCDSCGFRTFEAFRVL